MLVVLLFCSEVNIAIFFLD